MKELIKNSWVGNMNWIPTDKKLKILKAKALYLQLVQYDYGVDDISTSMSACWFYLELRSNTNG